MQTPKTKWRWYRNDDNRYVAQILTAKNEVAEEMGASLTLSHLTSVVSEYHPRNLCTNNATEFYV